MTDETFGCGHPRTYENTTSSGLRCAFCSRVQAICKKVKRDQDRLNRGAPLKTIGQRIAAGEI